MSRESRWWLAAAGVVTAVVAVVVLVYGIRSVPEFPGLNDLGAPMIDANAAVVRYEDDSCLYRLDVATGATSEVFCDEWIWIEGWLDDGRLVVHHDGVRTRRSAVDVETGDVERLGESFPEPQHHEEGDLRARSREGRATLTDVSGPEDVVLIDIEGPRMYGFWTYGRSGDWVWVVDSEERLLVVSADGTSGPWLVAEDVQDVAWR